MHRSSSLLTVQWSAVISHLSWCLLNANHNRVEMRDIVLSKHDHEFTTDILSNAFRCGVIDGQFHNVTARKDIAFILKLNLPRFRSGSQLQVGIMQWQQETMIELLTNLLVNRFRTGKSKTRLSSLSVPSISNSPPLL